MKLFIAIAIEFAIIAGLLGTPNLQISFDLVAGAVLGFTSCYIVLKVPQAVKDFLTIKWPKTD